MPATWPLYSVTSSVSEVVTDGGLVVGPDQAIAEAGARVLRAGGNAVDAAVAAALRDRCGRAVVGRVGWERHHHHRPARSRTHGHR